MRLAENTIRSRAAASLRTGAVALVLALAIAGAARAQAPGRVVSVGGAVTEVVYALGRQDRLVAVDSTSRHPAATRDLPDVGYMRRLSAEAILALAPDLVLAVADAGPPAVLDQLRGAGVRLVAVPDVATPAGVLAKVEAVAAALGAEAEGRILAGRLEAAFASVRRRIDGVTARPAVLFLLSVDRGAPMAAGRDTTADGIIGLAGGRNALPDVTGYRPIAPEALLAAAPDVILLSERTLQLLGGREALLARPEVAATPAGRAGRLVAMDGLLLLGFGPRTPQAVDDLATALHPGLPPAGPE